MIERLVVLDGVLADQSVTWLGSEREKRRYFKERLGNSLRDDEYPRLVFGRKPNITVRYFPDKLPIGYERDQYRHIFVYLARSCSPRHLRVFILRHLELLNALGFWTIRVLFPRLLAESMEACRKAAYELLTKPLTPSQTEELIWFLRQPQPLALDASAADRARLQAARRAFRSPRFAAIRRHWTREDVSHVASLAASLVSGYEQETELRHSAPSDRSRFEERSYASTGTLRFLRFLGSDWQLFVDISYTRSCPFRWNACSRHEAL